MKIEETVFAAIKENIEWKGEIGLNDKLINDLGIDSFGILMTVNSLETEFSIQIEDENLKGLITVSDIVMKLKAMLPVQ